VNLEGFGLKDSAPETAPARYARWLDELKSVPAARGTPPLPKLPIGCAGTTRASMPSARRSWPGTGSRFTAQGDYEIAGDPAHKIVNPVLYRWAEVAACWAAIDCPVLWVEAEDTDAHRWAGDAAAIARRVAVLQDGPKSPALPMPDTCCITTSRRSLRA